MTNHQRKGAISNAHVGREFEGLAREVLAKKGLVLDPNFALEVGWENRKKIHQFDLGSKNPPIIVECKSHTWTEGTEVPSAKLKNWSEAMLFFGIAPRHFKKIFFVLKDVRPSTGETLGTYYMRTHFHLIPDEVEFWEFDSKTKEVNVLCL